MTGLLRAFALFSVVPVPARELDRRAAAAAVRWFPLVGAGLGAVAGLPAAAVTHWASHAVLLGGVLAIFAIVLATRGLHLDGLADTADGLASRAPAEQALEIMRRSDIGPSGVLAIMLVLLVDVAAIASVGGGTWRPVAALAVAAATGRAAAVAAAHRRIPSARRSGFGRYVAGSQSTAIVGAEILAVLGFGAGLAAAVDASVAGWLAAQSAALAVAAAFLLHVQRRLGGVTGDVFGALVEITTAATVAGLALS